MNPPCWCSYGACPRFCICMPASGGLDEFGTLPRFRLLAWNCACVLAVGVPTSSWFCSPLLLFGNPAPLCRLTWLFDRAATPGFAGEPGGGGCAAFKRSDEMPARSRDGLPSGLAPGAPCNALAEASGGGFGLCKLCADGCARSASQPRPPFSFIQSYSPSSTSPVLFSAWVNRSRRKS